jgi:pimeloyl-ACP methyl ester carboxylesterase
MAVESVRIGALEVAYRRAGAGSPLLILPGATDDGRWWERQLRDLSARNTVIVWDAPGCGASSDPPTDWTLADFADCAAALIEALDVGPVHLLGLSFGGALAIEVVHRYPEKIDSLILVSAYAGWLGSLGPEETAARVAMAVQMPAMAPEDLIAEWLPTLVRPSIDDADRARVEQLLREARTHIAPTLTRALAVDLRPVLPTITVPTLVVHGSEDVRAPRPVADDLVARIPGAELAVIEGAGHVVNIDAPEQLAASIAAFLARHGAS